MAFLLTNKRRRPMPDDDRLLRTEAVDPELSSVNPRPTIPPRGLLSTESVDPNMSTLNMRPTSRPRLVFGGDDTREIEPITFDSTNSMRPRVDDPYAHRVDKLHHLENTPAKDANGRLKSFLLNGAARASEAARMAMATGQNPLAAALGGFVGGGAAGALRPSLDEEARNEFEKNKVRGEINDDLARSEKEAEVGYKQARPRLEAEKILADQKETQRKEVYDRERLKIQRDREKNRISEAEANRRLKELELEEQGRHNRASEANQAANASDKLKVPDTYYRGKNNEMVESQALERVLSSGNYSDLQFRPEVLEAYGNDLKKINRAIRNNDLQPTEAYSDPRKGASFQHDLARATKEITREAQEFDRAIDMTSKSASATRISYADFERTWEQFLNDYKTATPEQSDGIRRQFEQALARVRLIGE